MTKFEYCVVTLSFERKEGEINVDQRKKYLKEILNLRWAENAINDVKRFVHKEVVIANAYDAKGNNHEIMRIYTDNHEYSTVEYLPGGNHSPSLLLTSRDRHCAIWPNNYPITILAKCFAKLGQEGWEVVEYKFNIDVLIEFAQAILKRRV